MTKKKFRFNIIDLLVMLVLIAAVAVLAYIFVFSEQEVKLEETYEVEVVVEAYSLNSIFRDAIKEGDPVVFENNRSKIIGTVSAPPEVRESLKTGFDEVTGQEVYTPGEDLIDITITFRATAIKDEWGYRFKEIDNDVIVVNNNWRLIIGDTLCTVGCVDMTVIE